MMAGVFLDLESEKNTARVEAEQRTAGICRDPDGAVNKMIRDLHGTGLSAVSLGAIRADLQRRIHSPSRSLRMPLPAWRSAG
ncbi:MAG: hypothetical protein WCB46_05110 [Methanoregula sp.]